MSFPKCRIRYVASLADYLDQYSFAPPPVEFAVKDLLPRAKVELPARDRHHHLATHHLSLEMRVPVVLPSPVVEVLRDRFVRCESLQPSFIIIVETALVIIDEDRSRYSGSIRPDESGVICGRTRRDYLKLTGHQVLIFLVLVSAPPAPMATFTASSIGSLKGTSIRRRPCS